MLKNLENVAATVATRLFTLEQEYSKNHFKKENGVYQSPLHFEMFNEDPKIDPYTHREFLLATQRILTGAETLMNKINDSSVNDANTWCENVSLRLKDYVPKLVASKLHWHPKEQNYDDLKKIATKHKWPTNEEINIEQVVNLTLIQQLATTMSNLRNSARHLYEFEVMSSDHQDSASGFD